MSNYTCWKCMAEPVDVPGEIGTKCRRAIDDHLRRRGNRKTVTSERTHAKYRAPLEAADYTSTGEVRIPVREEHSRRESWDHYMRPPRNSAPMQGKPKSGPDEELERLTRKWLRENDA